MVESRATLRRRRWADVVVIGVGVFELMLAAYGALLSRPGGVAFLVDAPGGYYAAMGIGGTLAVTSAPVALRSVALARTLSIAAGVVLLLGLFALRTVDARAVLVLVLPALLLFAATPFLGPMPTPEEEGKWR